MVRAPRHWLNLSGSQTSTTSSAWCQVTAGGSLVPAGRANRSLLQASGFAAGAREPAHAAPATGFSTGQQPTVQVSNQTPGGSGGGGVVTGIQAGSSAGSGKAGSSPADSGLGGGALEAANPSGGTSSAGTLTFRPPGADPTGATLNSPLNQQPAGITGGGGGGALLTPGYLASAFYTIYDLDSA